MILDNILREPSLPKKTSLTYITIEKPLYYFPILENLSGMQKYKLASLFIPREKYFLNRQFVTF